MKEELRRMGGTMSIAPESSLLLDPSARVDALNDLADQLEATDQDRAYALSEDARRLAAEANPPYQKGLARSLHQMGIFRVRQSDYAVAMGLLMESLALAETIEDTEREAAVLNTLLALHHALGSLPEALEAGYRALKIAEARAETRLMACLLNNIGFLHIAMGQPQEALPFLTRSLASSCEAAICPVQAAALDSLSVAYRELGDFEQSLIYAHECQSFAHNHGLLRSEAEATSNIAQIHARNGDDVQALACFESALVHTRQIEYRPLEVTVLMETGRLHARQRAFEPALQCLQEALALAEQLDAKQQIIDVCEALANVFEQAENYAQALLFRKRYEVTKEAAFNTRSYYRMQSLQVAHEAEHARKEAEIYHLKNVALQTEIQEKQLALVDLDAFASMVAHDLKSPIATIVAYGELIMCDRGSTLSDEASQFLREAVSLGYAVAGMVDDLLTFARLRREEMVFEPLDMAPLIQSVEQRLNPLILERKAVILMPEDWPCALGNRGWVREIWINYISNAIHYGGEPPQVQLGATRQPDGMIRFWVKDNGAGITSERQKRLFSEFTRLRAVGNGGHGLGLSIVKRIVEKLGGEVGVESAGVRGLGSVFSFTLPAA